MLAAAQSGIHESGRQTFGHSLAVSPWGEVLAEAGAGTGVTLAEIDLAQAVRARARIPSLSQENSREFTVLKPAAGIASCQS
jgi:predicted amidohydrolase